MRKWSQWFVLGLIVILMAAAAAFGQDGPAQVPVRKIVLFTSGVGYFEHTGQVEGDATATLMFSTDQINDVLKSMLVMDLSDAGGVASVNYASQEPLAHALRSFAVDLSSNPTMAGLMAQLRGAEVTIQAPREMTGVIFGVETRQERLITDGTTTVFTQAILNLVTDDGLRAVPMDDIQQITLVDEDLQEELNKALALILASRDTDHKPVDINFVGEGTRDVRIGYVAEAPMWKTSYRLDLSGDQPRVQAWAIVENTSDSDWTDVHLSLVSGMPVSFIQDLYTPLYIPRPVITPKRASAVVRGRSASFIGPRMEMDLLEMDLSQAGGSGDAWAEDGYDIRDYAPAAAPAEASRSNMATVASGAAAGELFRFDLPEPVTLDRKTSAMLPLLDTDIQAEKVSIFNAAMGMTNPYNGVLLTNSSGMKLPAGPMTVLDGGMYAGDAILNHLAGDDDQLISYAVDLMVEVDAVDKYTSDLTAVKIVRGVLVMTHKTVFEQTYTVENKADAVRMMIIEHPYSPAMTLITPAEAFEQTPDWYRFRLEVPAGETRDLLVTTEQVHDERIAVMNCSAGTLAGYRKTGAFSEDVLDALAQVVAKRQEIGQLSEQLAALRQEVADLERSQNRLRQNLATVGNDSDLGREYLRKMAEQETRFDEIDKEIDELTEALRQANDALATFVNNLTVD
jgi:uncharacterized coiled-coil protein SlyX